MIQHPRTSTRLPRNRGGYLYVAVLMVTLIVSAVGFSAMSIARRMLANAVTANDAYEARLLANSGVEFGVNRARTGLQWRTFFDNDVDFPPTPYPYGNGSFNFKFIDDDGDLADTYTDGVWVYGTGQVGDAVQVQKARMIPSGPAVNSLETAFHCNGPIQFGSALLSTIKLTTNQTISTNSNISIYNFLSSNEIQGNAQATGSISGTVTGTTTPGMTPLVTPGVSSADYYRFNGTVIDINELPLSSGYRVVEDVVLSPAANPYGSETNPEGIYVIDCDGQGLRIRNCRVHGTLVLLNSTYDTIIGGSVNIEAFVENYPAIMADSNLMIAFSTQDLSEAGRGVNFNPAGTPYDGDQDADVTDDYPSHVKGLVGIGGDLYFAQSGLQSKFDGVVLCATTSIFSDVIFNYNPVHFENPPPGFGDGSEMELCPRSWQRASANE